MEDRKDQILRLDAVSSSPNPAVSVEAMTDDELIEFNAAELVKSFADWSLLVIGAFVGHEDTVDGAEAFDAEITRELSRRGFLTSEDALNLENLDHHVLRYAHQGALDSIRSLTVLLDEAARLLLKHLDE